MAKKGDNLGLIHIYTGPGKGKTTAALGLALRAVGHDLKIAIVHFMKIWDYGEVNSLQRLGIDLFRYGTTELIEPENPSPVDFEQAKLAMEKAEELVRGGAYDIVILDEITVAIDFNLISVQGVIDLIENKPHNLELILTGRTCPEVLIERADLVSRINEIKHPYQKGLQARKGIEF
ncbi:MAG: cob(I)yrinic acid a,c-diamide adenosyltransferase [Deltaproteobacteria bacterium]|nr:MAG: cob(I)yrinic acid a,c-diamide adenosyltransferase [Deltaproteobacteria bacterium]